MASKPTQVSSRWNMGKRICLLVLMTPASLVGCGGLVVVQESPSTDYDLCIEKRQAGGVSPEVAALDCLPVAAGQASVNS
ncbi:MAG: hypothetical protein VW642_02980 [Halieaceae bacterium]